MSRPPIVFFPARRSPPALLVAPLTLPARLLLVVVFACVVLTRLLWRPKKVLRFGLEIFFMRNSAPIGRSAMTSVGRGEAVDGSRAREPDRAKELKAGRCIGCGDDVEGIVWM